MNTLYYGDCLTIMQAMPAASIDLIYLDPPFNSKRAYNAIYKDETGRPLPAQIEAFNDKWTLDAQRIEVIKTMPVLMQQQGIDAATAEFLTAFMHALQDTQKDLAAYLSYMTERLLWMKRLLKDSGSIYLHCDPTASHYIKVMMDGIFGHKNFRNEIIWKRYSSAGKGSQHASQTWGTMTDTILYYAKSTKAPLRPLRELTEAEAVKKFPKVDKDGRQYNTSTPLFCSPSMGARPNLCYEWRGYVNPHPSGWRLSRERLEEEYQKGNIVIRADGKLERRKYEADYRGVPVGSLWAENSLLLASNSDERLGYATQKPLALLERIIAASSKPGDVVFDPFCGCATTIEAAHKLDRRWIGIDIAIHAIKRVAKVRLQQRLGLTENQDFKIRGVPNDLDSARDLWQRDTYHFQKWAVEQVDGFVTAKRSADGGIDGRIYFEIPSEKELQSMILEVKGGRNVSIVDVRSFGSVLHTSSAQMAGLIVMEALSTRKRQSFEQTMAQYGYLEIDGQRYPKMQIRTVEEILNENGFELPNTRGRSESLQPSLL